MIIKEIAHKMRWNRERKIQNLISYIFDESKVQEGGIIKRNISGYEKEKWLEQFLANDKQKTFNNINRSVIRHTVLSFSPDASPFITQTILTDIGKQYAHKRSNSLMVGAIHQEQGKPIHLHLMISSVDIYGGSSRLSRAEFRNLKVEMERYIEACYPDIHRTSYVEHNPDRDKPP